MGRRGFRFLGNFNSLNQTPFSKRATRRALSKSVTHSLSEMSIARQTRTLVEIEVGEPKLLEFFA